MKAKPVKKTRKSLKIKYISNEDIPKYMKGDEDYGEEEYGDEAHSDIDNKPSQKFNPDECLANNVDDSSNKCDIDTAEA